MKSLVSIIVPVYKPEGETLKRCIDSLVYQTYSNIEVILVDDNNFQDIGGEVIETYKSNFPQVRTFHQPNQGVSAARNLGIQQMNGKYVMFVDSDDYLERNAVEKFISYMDQDSYGMILSSSNVVEDENQILNKFYTTNHIEGELITDLLAQTLSKGASTYYPPKVGCGVPWSKMFHSNIIIDNSIKFNTSISKYEDLDFLVQYLDHIDKIYNISEPLYNYVIDDNSLSHGYRENIFEETKKSLDILRDTIENSKYRSLMYSLKIKHFTEINSIIKQFILNKKNPKSFKEKMNILRTYLKDSFFTRNINVEVRKMVTKEKVLFMLIKRRLALLLYVMFKLDEYLK